MIGRVILLFLLLFTCLHFLRFMENYINFDMICCLEVKSRSFKIKSYWLLHVYPYFKYTSSIATRVDWNNEWKWLHRWCILTKKSATLIFVSLKNILSWLVYCHVGEITLHKMSMKDSKGGWNRITGINAYWTPREVNWRQDQFFAFFWQICQLTCQ